MQGGKRLTENRKFQVKLYSQMQFEKPKNIAKRKQTKGMRMSQSALHTKLHVHFYMIVRVYCNNLIILILQN
jgi:hypothetical protein